MLFVKIHARLDLNRDKNANVILHQFLMRLA